MPSSPMANVAPEAASPAGHREEFVFCSEVRSGLKREFVFALKAQAEMLMTPMSRTRSGKIQRATAQPREGAAKRRRKSDVADLTAPSEAAEVSLSLPVFVDSASQEEASAVVIDEPAMAAIGGLEPMMRDAVDVVVSSVEVNCSRAEDSLPMQIENPIVPITPPAGTVVAEETAEGCPPVFVGAGALLEAPRAIQATDEVVKGNASSEPVGTELTMDGIHTEAEALADSFPLCQDVSGPAVESTHAALNEAEPVTFTLASAQVDVGSVAESAEVNAVQDIQAEVKQTMFSSVQVDAKPVPVMETPQIGLFEPEETASMASKTEVEGSTVMDALSENSKQVPQKTDEHAMFMKPTRRFTRSLLKAAIKEPEHIVVEEPPVLTSGNSPTASSVSDGSEENKDSVDTMNGSHQPPCMTPMNKMELKMSKKIELTKFPSNVKGLLATGLLDGLSVKYGTPTFHKQEGLHGVIKDGGILCFCASCKGLKTVSAYNFELHAGSKKKHPSDFIFLENGRTIRDVLKACSIAPLDMLETTIQNAVSIEGSLSLNQHKAEVSSTKSHIGKLASVCNSSLAANLSPGSHNSSAESTSTARHSRIIFSPKASDCSSSMPSLKSARGRMTQKDLRLHKLVFMDDILPDGTEVGYYARGQRLLKGYIKGSGIFCSCCRTVVSPSVFEAHAGWATRRKPYLNIYTSNGVSLHELSISLSKGKKFSSSESDDLCRICADGGDLLLCDLCPRAFHKECVGLGTVPRGDWYCPCCQNMHLKDKAVEHNENAIAAGRVAGVDPIEEIVKRCIRIVKTPEADVGGCVLCRSHDFSSGFGPRTVLLCDQCEREFHVGCLKEHDMADLKELPEGKWFCSLDCSKIHAALEKLVDAGVEQLPISLPDIMKKKPEHVGLAEETHHDVRWKLLSGKVVSSETRVLLSAALTIFHESFKPIVDYATKMDYITAMIYGWDIRDQDFGGMYCAVLTVNSSVVSAAILRILGCEVAELPLVATSRESQGKGYFQTLFSCIEGMLASLNVRHLVLPAADEAESIWTKRFGFSKMPVDELPEYIKGYRTLVFEGTSMLHKLVPESLLGR